jgi:methylmalonyl-CoA mutase, N-terminal domain
VEILRVDPKSEEEQVERLKEFKANRDHEELKARLGKLRETAEGDGNLLYPIRDALAEKATIGEVCGVMREVFGEYAEA